MVTEPTEFSFRVIAWIDFSDEEMRRLARLHPTYVATANPVRRGDKDEIVRRIGNASAILVSISTPITAEILESCPTLRFIQTWSTGTDHIDIDAARRSGVVVSNVPDFAIESVAERTIALMLLGATRMLDAHRHAQEGGWEYMRFRGIELKGRTLCLVGTGRIGKRVQSLAEGFGMHVRPLTSRSSQLELLQALAEADFVSIHCPANATSWHMLGFQQLRAMKPGVILINTSRGGIVEERALLTALNSGIVRYACLDVLEQEPPHKGHPLVTHPNVFITPHCAWNTIEASKRLNSATLAGVEAYLAGNPINRVV